MSVAIKITVDDRQVRAAIAVIRARLDRWHAEAARRCWHRLFGWPVERGWRVLDRPLGSPAVVQNVGS